MTAYLNWRGIPAYTLSLTRGLAALIGICGALSYPKVHAHLHTLQTGLWSIVTQVCQSCLLHYLMKMKDNIFLCALDRERVLMYLIRVIIPKPKRIRMEQRKSWRGICIECDIIRTNQGN